MEAREMKEKPLNEKESLEIITRMIQNTQEKGFSRKIPRTTCRVTKEGKRAFKEYVEALQTYIAKK